MGQAQGHTNGIRIQHQPLVFPMDNQNQVQMHRQFNNGRWRRARARRRSFANFLGSLPHTIRYNRVQREHAITLMNMGVSYRQTAERISPSCSSATTYRWQQQHLDKERKRRARQNCHRQHI